MTTFSGSSKGCFVSRCQGIFLLLLALAACAIVGIAVYYAHPDRDSNDSSEEVNAFDQGGDGMTTSLDVTSTTTSVIEITVEAMEPSMDVRLPLDLVPIHYDLRIRPDIYADDPSDFKSTGIWL